MSDQEDTRSHETVTEFKAPPEKIWSAIAEPEEIVRWFSPEARVEPGPDGNLVGGTMVHSWGPGMEGSSTIEIWEPNRRLRTVSTRKADEQEGGGDATVKVAVDYFIEGKDGVTTLRLVHSGFGRGADWDGEFEGTRKGWPIFFRVLKYSLEQHPGEAVRQISISLPVPLTPTEQWQRLFKGQLDGLQAGDRFSITAPTGELLEGTVDDVTSHGLASLAVENWNRSLLAVYCETYKGQGLFTIGLVIFGELTNHADAIESKWKEALTQAFA